jgi:hypothetical protein
VVVTPAPTVPPEAKLVVTSPMPHPERQNAAAALLADGRVLIVGGSTPLLFGRVGVYDAPGDGRPMLWGGFGRTEFGSGFSGLTSHQQFDWLTGEWATLRGPTFSPTVQLVESETRVYAVNESDLYQFDPSSTSWTLVEEGPTARVALGAIALADGRVVVFVQHEGLRGGGFRSGGATLVQEADPSQFQYVVINPRAGTRSAVQVLEGPPYRPQVYPLADGSLLLFGGFTEDPTAWETAVLSGVALPGPVLDAANGEQLALPSATPSATPPPRPPANTSVFRFDVDSGVLSELEVRDEDPEGTFRLDGQLYTLALPAIPVTPEGAERLYANLEGRAGAIVLPLDDGRVLVAAARPRPPRRSQSSRALWTSLTTFSSSPAPPSPRSMQHSLPPASARSRTATPRSRR